MAGAPAAPPAEPEPPVVAEAATLSAEPAPASTRKLIGSAAALGPTEMGPDPEERRLSAELDFGKPDRYAADRSGGGRRAILVIIALIIVICVAAVIFKDDIVLAVPSAEAFYAMVGLK